MVKALIISDFRHAHAARPEAEIFLALHVQGVYLEIMTPAESAYARRFQQAGIPVHDFRPARKYARRDMLQIRERLVRDQFQVLHVLNRKAMTSAIVAARRLPVAVILYRGASRGIRWYDPSAYLKYLHPRVDAIVCNTPGAAATFRRQPFFDAAKIAIIPKGHDPAWYAAVAPVDRGTLGIPEGTCIVACVANVRRVKGVPVLLEAMKRLPATDAVHFLLIGEGMHEVVETADLTDAQKSRIHATGFISDPLPLMAVSDLLVLPSLSSEALTKSVIEAMSLGIAPVITDLPGNAGLVTHGETGLK
ncbi:MAG: glycosyltransferase family 4 protein, partial [Saprospiraceae bacterium]|nr:glycosyltransferase family 4 protein [Saprospiraceae bacterium]